MKLVVEVAGKTDVGCVRTNNEDNFGWDARYGIFVVCDGMGGQAAGEVASKLAVDEMLKYFRSSEAQGADSSDGDSSKDDASATASGLMEEAERATRAKPGSAELKAAID